MLFANPHNVTISKRIQGVDYVCPPGELVEIPDKYAYVIKVEGVMLVPAESATLTEKPEPEQKPQTEHRKRR